MLIHVFLILLSAAGTAMLFVLPREMPAYGWSPLIFLGFWVALQLLHVLSILLLSLFLRKDRLPDHPKKWVCAYIRYMMRWLLSLCNTRVILVGEELLPDEPSVIVCNHRSMMDPMVAIRALSRRTVVFISKIENFKIPIVKRFFAHAGFLPIDRENAMQAMRQIRRGVRMMKEDGVDVGIYPEGTRSKSGALLEFKDGAFLLAKKADAPLVVMTARNTASIRSRAPFRHTKVELRVLEVLDRETVKALPIDALSARIRTRMLEDLDG